MKKISGNDDSLTGQYIATSDIRIHSSKNYIMVGPSYSGKSTLGKSLVRRSGKHLLIEHRDYRGILAGQPFLRLLEYIITWFPHILVATRSLAIGGLSFRRRVLVFIRLIRYGYTSFGLMKCSNEPYIIDEDLIKKLIDSVPQVKNFHDYNASYRYYENLLTAWVPTYLRVSAANLRHYIITDCAASTTITRADERISAELAFGRRQFITHFTLERRLYRVLARIMLTAKIEFSLVNTGLSRESNK